MDQALKAYSDFQAIAFSKEDPGQTNDSPQLRKQFKEYLEKTFNKYPEVIEIFEEVDYDPACLDEISKMSLEDESWINDYKIKNKLHKMSFRSFSKQALENDSKNQIKLR